MKRLRELDFLRGIAIILVFFRHQYLFEFTHNMGWIGVDLFFVLSGFLVSGLLFKEYLKFGYIKPKRFLIRRGFKIYPIYYLSYPIYLFAMLYKEEFSMIGLLSDLTFTQNYFWGWGYAYSASWSLAVEEHFYFGFSIILWLGLRFNRIKLQIDNSTKGLKHFELVLVIIMAICLVLRLMSNFYHPERCAENFTMTHLRIDSLLMGVLISYLFYFRKEFLQKFFLSYNKILFTIAFLGIIWTPFIQPIPSFFTKTYGFSLLYISFGILLLSFLLIENINLILNRLFTSHVVNLISKIGYCSYSIYIIHLFVNGATKHISLHFHLSYSHYFIFFLTSVISVLIGMLMTYKIEKYFLSVRDKLYPGRSE